MNDRPTCEDCGQLLLLLNGRTQCERCRLYGPPTPGADVVQVQRKVAAVPVPCTGCGRDVLDDGTTPVPLADGYCLSCRLDNVHQAAVQT